MKNTDLDLLAYRIQLQHWGSSRSLMHHLKSKSVVTSLCVTGDVFIILYYKKAFPYNIVLFLVCDHTIETFQDMLVMVAFKY